MHIEDNHYDNLGSPDPVTCYICYTDRCIQRREEEMFDPNFLKIKKVCAEYERGIITVKEFTLAVLDLLPVVGV
jgi:hypothetical protein